MASITHGIAPLALAVALLPGTPVMDGGQAIAATISTVMPVTALSLSSCLIVATRHQCLRLVLS